MSADPRTDPPTEFTWLIERGQPEKQAPTMWWSDRGWIEDANRAARFVSREAAEEVIEAKFTPPASRGGPSARAVEHGFIARSTVPVEPRERSCVFCRWSGEIGATAHATLIHPDEPWVVVVQMGREFVVKADAARASQPITARPDLTTALRIALDRLDAYIDATDDETVGDGDTDEDRDFIREVREVLGPPPVVYPRGYNHRLMCSRMHAVTAPCDEALAALPVREDEPTGIDAERLAAVVAFMRSEYGWYIGPMVENPADVTAELIAAEYDRLTREASHVR